MNREKATRWLALLLGVAFILDGIAETVRVVTSGDGGLAFWFLSLCGGGTLILIGMFVVNRPWSSFALIAVGCLGATLATAWTIVMPLLTATLVTLALVRAGEASDAAAASAG